MRLVTGAELLAGVRAPSLAAQPLALKQTRGPGQDVPAHDLTDRSLPGSRPRRPCPRSAAPATVPRYPGQNQCQRAASSGQPEQRVRRPDVRDNLIRVIRCGIEHRAGSHPADRRRSPERRLVDAGPADGLPVLLLHGWPYDIHSFVEVVPMLVVAGHRVIVPYARLRDDAVSIRRDVPQWRASGGRTRCHCVAGRTRDRERCARRLRLGSTDG